MQSVRNAVRNFQFRYGAIETFLTQGANTVRNAFQFRYGAIETKEPQLLGMLEKPFNSAMVRLRQ